MAFATSADVATRLGRELTDLESDTADLIIDLVTGLISEAAAEDSAWATALTPVPSLLRLLCIEKAVSAIVNPHSLASFSEQLGQYQHSGTYPRASDVGLFLSDDESRRVRFAVYGTETGSVVLPTIFEEV